MKIKADFSKKDISDLRKVIRNNKDITLDFSDLEKVDNLTLSFIYNLLNRKTIKIITNDILESKIKKFALDVKLPKESSVEKADFLSSFLIGLNNKKKLCWSFICLSSDILYFGILDIFNKKKRRAGSVYEQINIIGTNAIFIVSLLSFLIGFILSLQSAQHLKQFGANIFLVDLVVISMITEMGPMITAVIIAGRSGSAIAAEIATMNITEELDALRVMALNPLRFTVIPKLYGLLISLPLLTIISNIVGIFGGFLIAINYLEISSEVFTDRMFVVMKLSYWVKSLFKSIIFAFMVIFISVFYGYNINQGAEGVGKSTTASVVASIFAVIVSDALLSIVFYFEF